MLFVTQEIAIPDSELTLSYARSSGPGGQNVNKVNSKAVLRWNVHTSSQLPLEIRARLMKFLESQLTREGEIVISSDRFRDQIRNREDCFEKLRQIILRACVPPKPRKKTKPTRSSQNKLKNLKKKHSDKKNMRKLRFD